MSDYKIGDIVTINARIYDIRRTFSGVDDIFVITKNGNILCIREEDINTICPKIEIPAEDKRRGE